MTKCEGGGASAVPAAVWKRESASEKSWQMVQIWSENVFVSAATIIICLLKILPAAILSTQISQKSNNYNKHIKIGKLCYFVKKVKSQCSYDICE